MTYIHQGNKTKYLQGETETIYGCSYGYSMLVYGIISIDIIILTALRQCKLLHEYARSDTYCVKAQ